MGTKMVPAHVALFIHKLETEFLNTQTLEPLTWIWYLDSLDTQ